MGKLFDNPTSARWIIGIFVVLAVLLFARIARGEQTLSMEVGSAVLRGETPALGFTIGCPGCGPVNTDYEFGFELIGQSSHHRDNPNVIQLHAQIVDGYKDFELGLGFGYFNVEHEYTCQFTFHLMARYRMTERVALQWRHASSAGSCKPNAGRDLLQISVRLGR